MASVFPLGSPVPEVPPAIRLVWGIPLEFSGLRKSYKHGDASRGMHDETAVDYETRNRSAELTAVGVTMWTVQGKCSSAKTGVLE